jgi:hypothetical protein
MPLPVGQRCFLEVGRRQQCGWARIESATMTRRHRAVQPLVQPRDADPEDRAADAYGMGEKVVWPAMQRATLISSPPSSTGPPSA